MKRVLIMVVLCHLAICCFGQSYQATASLPKAERSGFHRIPLSPEIISSLKPGFSNLRILDSLQQEIPYLIKAEIPVFSSVQFLEYPILEKKINGTFTEVVFSNLEKKSISNISLFIKNAETYKEASLLGSDDHKIWYALKESFFLTSLQGINQTYEIRIVDFPLSNYSFIKLKINDSTSAPLNILKAGYYNTSQVTGNYTSLSSQLTITENKEQKKTILRIKFDTVMLVDKLEFEIQAPALYNRSAQVLMPVTRTTQKGKKVIAEEYIQTIQFISSQQGFFHLPSVATKELIIEIRNEDNPPLKITSMKAFQLNRYMISFLEKERSYTIGIRTPNSPPPSYDISYFKDSIPSDPPL